MKKTPIFVHPWGVTRQAWSWINEDSLKNKIIDIALRAENNLIILDGNNELYTDLQLEDWLSTSDELPVGVTVWRVLQANWRPATWTLISAKTTSGDNIKILYGDDGEIRVDNGTWEWSTLQYNTTPIVPVWDMLPSNPEQWTIFFNTNDAKLYIYDWTNWNYLQATVVP